MIIIRLNLRSILQRALIVGRVPALIAGGLALVYSSAVSVPFARADDYSYYLSAFTDPFWFFTWQVRTGRVLQGILSYLTYKVVPGIEEYYFLRIIGVAGIILVAWQLYALFWSYRITRSASAWLAFSICVMPAFTYYAVSAATMYVPFAFALGVLSGQCSCRIPLASTPQKRIILATICLISFAGATLIYEPAAMGFWIPVVMFLFGRRLSVVTLIKRFVLQAAIFAVIGATMYLTYILEGVHDSERTPLSPNLAEKFLWFLGKPLEMALNLFVVPPLAIIGIIVLALIIVGFWLYLNGDLLKRFVGLISLLITLPLSFLPHLISSHTWPIYRTQVALTSLLVLYGFFALKGYSRLLESKVRFLNKYVLLVAVAIFSVTSGFLAARNTLINVAVPNLIEFGYLKSRIAEANITGVKTIYVIRPHWEDGFAAEKVEEFGAMTSYWDWGAVPMTQVALHELGYDYNAYKILTFGPDDILPSSDGTLVIDMRKIDDLK